MVLIADNEPYHHSREIGTVSNLTKTKLVDLMIEVEVDYCNVSLIEKQVDAFQDEEDDYDDYESVTCMGDDFIFEFEETMFKDRASHSKPFIPNLQELQLGFVAWSLKENRPDKLKCKVEDFFREIHFKILWTSPYYPNLQKN